MSINSNNNLRVNNGPQEHNNVPTESTASGSITTSHCSIHGDLKPLRQQQLCPASRNKKNFNRQTFANIGRALLGNRRTTPPLRQQHRLLNLSSNFDRDPIAKTLSNGENPTESNEIWSGSRSGTGLTLCKSSSLYVKRLPRYGVLKLTFRRPRFPLRPIFDRERRRKRLSNGEKFAESNKIWTGSRPSTLPTLCKSSSRYVKRFTSYSVSKSTF